MNFGKINKPDCLTVPPQGDTSVPDGDCSNPAWALAHPDLCQTLLFIKPGVITACVGKTVQLGAFLATNTPLAEQDVTTDAIFQSSDDTVASVGVATGNLTLVKAGMATISATYQGLTAHCEVVVIAVAGDGCCSDISVATMLLVDVTKSKSLLFNNDYASRLAFSKFAVNRLISEMDSDRDRMGIITFEASTVKLISALTNVTASLAASVSGIAQTKQLTSFYDGMKTAIAALAADASDQKVLVIFSDGEDNHTTFPDDSNPVTLASDFKALGGIVIAIAVRASDDGYRLMRALATDGYFLNAYGIVAQATLDYLSALKSYYCDGILQTIPGVEHPTPVLHYTDFAFWTVTTGQVDLLGSSLGGTLFDYNPGHGMYVGLTGRTSSLRGAITTQDAISIIGDRDYRLTVNLSGSQRHSFGNDVARVRVFTVQSDSTITYHLDQNIGIPSTDTFQDHAFTFTSPYDCDVFVSVEQIDAASAFPEKVAILLKSVKFENVTDGLTFFDENFDAEHPVVGDDFEGQVIPAMPPVAQRADPNKLPDVESGSNPPRTYTSTKLECAACAVGSVSVNPNGIIPAVADYASPSGIVSASLEYLTDDIDADPKTSPAWYAFANPSVNVIGSVSPSTIPWLAAFKLRVAGADNEPAVNGDYDYVGNLNGQPHYRYSFTNNLILTVSGMTAGSAVANGLYTWNAGLSKFVGPGTAYIRFDGLIGVWRLELDGVENPAHPDYLNPTNLNPWNGVWQTDLQPAPAPTVSRDSVSEILWNGTNWEILLAGRSRFTSGSLLNGWVHDFSAAPAPTVTALNVPVWLQFVFVAQQTVRDYEVTAGIDGTYAPKTFKLQGSNDGATWTDLDSREGLTWFSYETKRFRIEPPAAFTYYRLYITATGNNLGVQVQQLSFFLAPEEPVCKDSTQQSEVSQSDADQKAQDAALQLAQAALTCRPVFTSTQSYPATCPLGEIAIGAPSITATSTRISFNSKSEAEADALRAAMASARSQLNCGGSNNDQQIAITLPAPNNAVKAGAPYPSVKHVAGLLGVITKVTPTVKGIPFSFFNSALHARYSLLLQSPVGTLVELTRGVTPQLYANVVNQTYLSFIFDDAGLDIIRPIGTVSDVEAGDVYSVDDAPLGEYTFTVKPTQGRAFGEIGLAHAPTNPADGDTLTIGAKTYTAKTVLTPTEGQILIGGTPKATMLNLAHAINHTGVPGTDYSCAAVHPTVYADVSSFTGGFGLLFHAIVVHAKAIGAGGNALALVATGTQFQVNAATLLGGYNVAALPTPAPQVTGDYNLTLAAFIGENPNGNWKLWAALVSDDGTLAIARITQGWDLAITSA